MAVSKEILDQRFAEKMKARKEGRTPVIVTVPELPVGNSQAQIDARFRAKLARHHLPHTPIEAALAAEDESGDDEAEANELSSMTNAQLLDEAASLGLTLSKGLNKAQLIEAIEAALAAEDE